MRAAIYSPLALTLGLLCLMTPGCGYPEVSPKAYELATALYSTCNRHDADRLEPLRGLVAQAEEAEEISREESGWLRDIIVIAEGNDWDRAAAMSRRMLRDQVQRLE